MTIPRSELCARYRRTGVSVVCDALYELGLPERVLPSALKPLLPDVRMAGIAHTLEGRAIRPGVGWDRGLERIKSYLEMFEELPHDSVLVSCNPDSEVGHFGELTGNSAQQYGCTGVVLDGNLRDLDGLLDIGRGLSEPQLVPKPLDERTGDRNRPFEGIVHALRVVVGDRGEQTGLRRDDLLTGVHQQEGAGPVGALRLARTAPQLTKQRRLLVADDPGDRHPASERPVGRSLSPGFRVRGGSDLGKHPAGHGEGFEQLLAPAELPEIHHEGPAGVGRIRPVHGSSGQLPHQPGFHRAEHGASRPGPVPETIFVVEEPA